MLRCNTRIRPRLINTISVYNDRRHGMSALPRVLNMILFKIRYNINSINIQYNINITLDY